MRSESTVCETVAIPAESAIMEVPQSPALQPARTRIKKLPPALRRRRIPFHTEPRFFRRFLWRLKEDSQFLRTTIQITFALLCVWIGIEFALFVRWGTSGGTAAFAHRPPGAEGFLPISALISLKYLILSGIVNNIHPAGLFIFIAILLVSFVAKKAFCSWLCPIGTLSESLWNLGARLFGRTFLPPKWIDIPLRSLKYLLLLFFLYIVWVMDEVALRTFIDSPYNRVADVKMYFFFAHITTFALWTIIILMLLSLVIRNFWCRYLCPYGALLGLTGLLSPLKVTRTKSTCIDCELCTKVCPSGIKVHLANRVWSDECTSCLQCVEICPVKETLTVRAAGEERSIPNWVFGTLVVGIFVAITGLAMLSGHWQNAIPQREYLDHFRNIDSPLYEHQRGLR